MSNPYLGEIRIFGCNFAPTGWAACNGQLLPIAQNTALFSLLGTYYGGDGISTFALPNLQGSVPIDMGTGAGLSQYLIGQRGGASAVALTPGNLPNHNHTALANPNGGTVNAPANAGWAEPHLGKTGINAYTTDTTHNVTMNGNALSQVGGNQPHNNMSPYLVLNFCIAQTEYSPPDPNPAKL